jgi:predicted nucleic acid-binding protein
MEFLVGAHPHERPRISRRFEILPYLSSDQKLWREAATYYATLRGVGVRLPWNYALVATITLRQGCRVYAVDPHFEVMAQHLGLRLYTPGSNGSFVAESWK